jgi:glycosyltransferase involved in cell wall biosynthesis
VAVPFDKDLASTLAGEARYRALTFEEALRGAPAFPDGAGPDLIHGWTPREVVREFCQAMQSRYGCRVFVHMEDNEWHLLSCALGKSWNQIVSTDDEHLDRMLRPHLSHPRKGFQFMSEADGITVIIDRLRELIPQHVPCVELWPSADRKLFKPLPRIPRAREILGIPKNSAVIVYPGNVHAANAHEMRSLYLAVAILNREGMPTTLVRAGRDFCPFLGEQDQWGRRNSIELGAVAHKKIPSLLALADVLIQPGEGDSFNDYRFPSKLPEFLSAARPVIIPNTNIAGKMVHCEHAYILERANAVSIAHAVKEILLNSDLKEKLSKGALEFSTKYLSWSTSARKLDEFYTRRDIALHPVIRPSAVPFLRKFATSAVS